MQDFVVGTIEWHRLNEEEGFGCPHEMHPCFNCNIFHITGPVMRNTLFLDYCKHGNIEKVYFLPFLEAIHILFYIFPCIFIYVTYCTSNDQSIKFLE